MIGVQRDVGRDRRLDLRRGDGLRERRDDRVGLRGGLRQRRRGRGRGRRWNGFGRGRLARLLDGRAAAEQSSEEAASLLRLWRGVGPGRRRLRVRRVGRLVLELEGGLGLGGRFRSSGSGSTTGSAASVALASGAAVSVTFVPHPEGSSATVPRAMSPSQATAVSGSSRVMRISPNSPRWRARAWGSLISAHNSGGDFTRVRCARDSTMTALVSPPGGRPPAQRFGVTETATPRPFRRTPTHTRHTSFPKIAP